MAKRQKNGSYVIQMVLSKEDYDEWKERQKESKLSESGYCREMNLIPRKLPGAPLGNRNAARKKSARRRRAATGSVREHGSPLFQFPSEKSGEE